MRSPIRAGSSTSLTGPGPATLNLRPYKCTTYMSTYFHINLDN